MNQKLIKGGIIALIAVIFGIVLVVNGISKVKPGDQAFIFRPWTTGVDTVEIYSEGTHIIAPWNELISYKVQQQKVDEKLDVLDKKGLTVAIDVSVLYNAMPGKIGNLHLLVGKSYTDVIVIPQARSIIREVVGQFTAEELYSTERDQLQAICKSKLESIYGANNIVLQDVLIRDVDLPNSIKLAIEAKEKQEQDNQRAEKKNQEAQFLANAKITTAQGDSASVVIAAQADALSIELKQKQLRKSPQYVELIYAEGYKEHGKSRWGEGNFFGVENAAILKNSK